MINVNDDFFRFVDAHASDDPFRLRLAGKGRYGFDYELAVVQIEARRKSRTKLPDWHADRQLLFPSVLAVEQASSEQTALYKQRLIKGQSVGDLTGGLGIDAWAFSRCAPQVTYVERHPFYAEVAAYNFRRLGMNRIRVVNADCRDYLAQLPEMTDTFFIDPARRDKENKRLYALTDCEPDVLSFLPVLMKKGKRLIIKASPMIDISQTLGILPFVSEVHIVSVRNECKELLFAADPGESVSPEIICADLYPDGSCTEFRFLYAEEKEQPVVLAAFPGRYLYEPNASVMKAGAFKTVGVRYGVEKLDNNSHLYTSGRRVAGFPGREFEVAEILDFSGKLLKELSGRYPAANLTVRNFPVSVAELRKKSGVREGGDIYIFATILASKQKVLIVCRKLGPDYTA